MAKLTFDHILLYGDSLTEFSLDPNKGWGSVLANAYVRRAEVSNRGFAGGYHPDGKGSDIDMKAGYTSRWCRSLISAVLRGNYENSSSKPLLMTLWLGANDAIFPEYDQSRAVPIPEYEDNLMAIMETAKALQPKLRILVMAPPPNDGRNPDRTFARTKTYRNACLKVGREAQKKWPDDIELFDSYSIVGVRDDMDMDEILGVLKPLLSDGIHFSPAGNELIGNAILRVVSAKWPDLDPRRMPYRSPELFEWAEFLDIQIDGSRHDSLGMQKRNGIRFTIKKAIDACTCNSSMLTVAGSVMLALILLALVMCCLE
ncbi:hypothetical protein HDU67_002308 [Dinochytrium kinnereticum]|nr:hypothetical protein HDU67_002308 [Dinochytrium kinnereticum]